MRRRRTTVCAIAALAALTFGDRELAARAALPRPNCDWTQPIQRGQLVHLPSGQASVAVTSDDRLLVTNLGSRGGDGVCTVVPNWNGIVVDEPTPIRVQRDEVLTLTFASPDGRQFAFGVRHRPDGRMRGLVNWTVGGSLQREVTRNGVPMASEVGSANHGFDLPDMELTGWSFHGITGVFVLKGADGNGDAWQVTITPVAAATGLPLRRWAITLGTEVNGRSFLDGVGQGCDLQSCPLPQP